MGRAHLFLKDRDTTPYRETILYACTHDLTFDRQCEDSRADYLFGILQRSNDLPYYRVGILAALTASGPEDENSELFALAQRLAQHGDDSARQVMYATFARNAAQQDFTGAEEIIHLDGADGLLFATDYLLRYAPQKIDDFHYWLGELEERDGKEAAWQQIESAGKTVPDIAKLLPKARAKEEEYAQLRQQNASRKRIAYPTLKELIAEQSANKHRVALFFWGRDAREDELKQAAAELLAEQDPARLLAYLRIFRQRRFPLDHSRFLTLARDSDEAIRDAALYALRNISHPTVREFALELAQHLDQTPYAVMLLTRNFVEGDYRLIERLLELPLDRNDYHWLGINVRAFVEKNLNEAAVPSLLHLYENGPCSLCRQHTVELLLALKRLPDWMREECYFDANQHIRELVSSLSH